MLLLPGGERKKTMGGHHHAYDHKCAFISSGLLKWLEHIREDKSYCKLL